MDQMELCEELEKKNGDELELLGQEEVDIVRKHLLSRFLLQTGTKGKPFVPVYNTNRDKRFPRRTPPRGLSGADL